jgi:hypothetical protein
MRRVSVLLAATLAIAGCAGDRGRRDSGPEFAGRTMRVVAADGRVTTLRFRRGGTVLARFDGRESAGRWALQRRELCFTWARGFRECWPYRDRFERGRTVALTSDRGNRVRVTLE